MAKKDILQIAVKIFGLYFLAQAVLSFPRFITSIWMSCSLYEPSGTNNGDSITHQLFEAAINEIPGHCVSGSASPFLGSIFCAVRHFFYV